MGSAERRDDADASAQSSAQRDPLVGSVVNGKFAIKSVLAHGGMSRVYRASQLPLERPVALKVVRGDHEDEANSQFLRRFLLEASILAKLSHPNIVTLYDYGKVEDAREGGGVEQYFIAMEYLDGETLAEHLAAHGPWRAARALALAKQVARGLREAHAHGIVHRDLKPSNILLSLDLDGLDKVKLVDFGIGKVLKNPVDSRNLTIDGVFIGTPRYMAPEQFDGVASPASDLHALGTILFEILTGELPFVANTMTELLVAKTAKAPRPLLDVNPDLEITPRFQALVLRLLATEPEPRPTMEDLLAELAACEEEIGARTSVASARTLQSAVSSRPSEVASQSSPLLVTTAASPRARRPEPSASDVNVPSSKKPRVSIPPPSPRATMPSSPEARRSRTLAVVVFLAAVIAIVAFIALGAHNSEPFSPHAPNTSTTPHAVTQGPEHAGQNAQSFTLSVDSTPSGATLSEGDTRLGVTPLQLTIDRSTVHTRPRTFTLEKSGYATTRVVQGDSSENVRSVVTLAPAEVEPSASPKPVPSATSATTPSAGGSATQGTQAPKPQPSPSQPAPTPTDIRLRR